MGVRSVPGAVEFAEVDQCRRLERLAGGWIGNEEVAFLSRGRVVWEVDQAWVGVKSNVYISSSLITVDLELYTKKWGGGI